MKKELYESKLFAQNSRELFPFKVCIEEENNKGEDILRVIKTEYRSFAEIEQEKRTEIMSCSWKTEDS